MTIPNPEPLKAALLQLRAGRQQIAALRAKAEELTASLANLDPLDDAAMTAAASRQMALTQIPARIKTLETALEEVAAALFKEQDRFQYALREVAMIERELKLDALEAKFQPYFASRRAQNGEVTNRARQIAAQADVFYGIPGETVGTVNLTGEPRSNNPASYDRSLEARAEELLSIFTTWQANGNAFGGKVE
jgi:DNA-directed RNA polymerase subunit K/omega